MPVFARASYVFHATTAEFGMLCMLTHVITLMPAAHTFFMLGYDHF
jgi:hypothetical protein